MFKKKYLYTCRYMYIFNRSVFVSKHAITQAIRRNVTPDMLEAAINSGKVKKFGKNFLKISKQYKNGKVVCVCEIINGKIIIKTVYYSK